MPLKETVGATKKNEEEEKRKKGKERKKELKEVEHKGTNMKREES